MDVAPQHRITVTDELAPDHPLRVAALIKQVPVAEAMSLGPDGRLRRSGTQLELNPYCRRAVSKGAQLARVSGGRCTAITLGPPSAEDVLREAVAWGAAEGVHLCDPAFAGSDTLATARALAGALVREGPFDVVLVGRNTIDGDTGQVGPQIAQLLGLPFVTGVRRLQLDGSTLRLESELDDGWQTVEVALPVVLSVAERLCEPAKVDPEGRAAVEATLLRRVTASQLGPGPWGEAGSPTKVGAVRTMQHERACKVLAHGTLDEQVGAAVAILDERGALPGIGRLGEGFGAEGQNTEREKGRGAQPAVGGVLGQGGRVVADDAGRAVERPAAQGLDTVLGGRRDDRMPGSSLPLCVVVEPDRSHVSGELLSAARRLLGSPLDSRHAVAAGRVVAFGPAEAIDGQEQRMADLGADIVVAVEGATVPEDVAAALTSWVTRQGPAVVLAPSTSFGREVAGRSAAALGAGLIGDAIGVELVDGRVVAPKPALSGALVADISCTSEIQMVTVRPGVLPPGVPSGRPRAVAAGPPTVVREGVQRQSRLKVLGQGREDDVEVLARAEAIVGVGTGVTPAEYDLVRQLATVLGAELAATRKVTDKGWMPRARQVGITGRSVAPRLYVAVGLSGKFNHVVGVRAAATVLAVNRDPEAPIFGHADVGIVGDWHDVLPVLVAHLEDRGHPRAAAGIGGEEARAAEVS